MCLEISGGQRNPGSCDSILKGRGGRDLDWGGVLEGEHWVDSGRTLHSARPPWAFSLPPPLLGTLALRWAQSFLTLPVSHSRPSEEQCGLGVDSPGRLQGRKCQAMPWPQHPVIWSSPGLIIGWHALCPPSPVPHRAGTPTPQPRKQEKDRRMLLSGAPSLRVGDGRGASMTEGR